MKTVGRKRQKKLAEGAGLFLSLLRGEIQNSVEDEVSSDENSNNVDVAGLICATQSQGEILAEKHEKSSAGSTPIFEPNFAMGQCIAEDAAATLENLLGNLPESCSHDMDNLAPSPSHYADYHCSDKTMPREVLCDTISFCDSPENFIKGCKWSPDGAYLSVSSNDRRLRVFSLPEEFYSGKYENFEKSGLSQVNFFNAGELIYDFCWYPFICQPSEFCTLLAYTSCDHPIHLRDVNKNEVVATYSPKNHLDERATAFSLCFSLDGRHLYAGFKDCIRVFDFLRPGAQISTKNTKGDKKMMNGQRGIISCISMSPNTPNLYACGSYNKTIAIYADELKDPQFVLQGHVGGVTHLMYGPDGNSIFSGGRKDDEILCWDMRQLGTVLCVFGRKVETNQRIYFDIDKNGKYLMTGNTDGTVKIWDLKCPSENIQFEAHTDCTNSVSFNPFQPLIASGCGQRKFDDNLAMFSDDEHTTSSNSSDEICIKIWRACT